MVEIRKIQKPTGKTKESYVRIPKDMGFNPGDNVKFEKKSEIEICITKIL